MKGLMKDVKDVFSSLHESGIDRISADFRNHIITPAKAMLMEMTHKHTDGDAILDTSETEFQIEIERVISNIDLHDDSDEDYEHFQEMDISLIEESLDKNRVSTIEDKEECEECIKKVVTFAFDKVSSKTKDVCAKVADKKYIPEKLKDFCKLYSSDPKKAVKILMVKFHLHPILFGYKLCTEKGYCAPPPKPGPHHHDDDHNHDHQFSEMKDVFRWISEKHQPTVNLLKTLSRKSSHLQIPKNIQKSTPACQSCVKNSVAQAKSVLLQGATRICQFSDKIPVDSFKTFCDLLESDPSKAVSEIMKELHITNQMLKQAAMQACAQQGICSSVSGRMQQM